MYDWVTRQILHATVMDSDFLSEWTKMTAEQRARHHNDLKILDRRRKELEHAGLSCRTLHVETSKLTRGWSTAIPEVETRERLEPQKLIKFALDADRKQHAYEYGHVLLSGFLNRCPVPVKRFYGGIKAERSIAAKIALYHKGGPLDLDDLVRFRFVLEGLNDMSVLCRCFAENFDIRRCRNYYGQPRLGADDPYRAIHFGIFTLEGILIEVQVQTALREAVGLADHSLVLKKSVDYISRQHCEWLRNISFVANVVDCERILSDSVKLNFAWFPSGHSTIVAMSNNSI